MPVVKRRFNYGFVLLNPLVVGKTKALCGNSVSVYHGNDKQSMHSLGGFVEISGLSTPSALVGIRDIDAYSNDETVLGNWTYFGENALVQGHVEGAKAYIHLYRSFPIAYCALDTPRGKPRRPNNVVQLFSL